MYCVEQFVDSFVIFGGADCFRAIVRFGGKLVLWLIAAELRKNREAEENNGGRSNSTKDSIREHREESADKHMSKSTGFPNTDGRKVGSGQAGVRKKMDSEVQRMMNALGLSGRYYITCGEIGGGPAERTGHRERDTHIAHETRSTMGEPSKR